MALITALPTPPARTMASATFIAAADAFLAALPAMVTQINSVITAFNAAQSGTSTTSLTVGAGNQTFTTQTGLGFLPGQSVFISSTATPATRMAGTVTAYNSATGSMTVAVTSTAGAGTLASWQIGLNAMSIQTPADVAAVLGYTATPDLYRNRVINGAMQVDNRRSGASVTPTTNAYIIDKWIAIIAQASKLTFGQNLNAVAPPNGFTNYLGAKTAAAYTPLTGDYFIERQSIEGYYLSDFMWGSATAQNADLSFWVYSSLTGNFGGSIQNAAQNRSYPFTYSVAVANTWTKITLTIPGDTAGVWVVNSGVGAIVNFSLGAGATFQSAAGAWAAGNFATAPGQVNVVATLNAVHYITGVHLGPVGSSTVTEWRPYPVEQSLCLRYFRLMTVVVTTTSIYQTVLFEKMRTTPIVGTVTFDAGAGATFVSGSSGQSNSFVYQNTNHSQVGQASFSLDADF
jgi:hypothetical protein